MSEAIVYIDTSRVREGKVGELREAVDGLAAFVEENEPRTISYNIYLDEERSTMTVVQVHPDSASLEFHMEVAGPAFRPFADLLTLESIEIFGEPSEKLLDQLRQKAEMLGSGTVATHDLRAGFSRLPG